MGFRAQGAQGKAEEWSRNWKLLEDLGFIVMKSQFGRERNAAT